MPPPRREAPFKSKAIGNAYKKLTAQDVIVARGLVSVLSIKDLAITYGVSYGSMLAAVKGWTFKHLNHQCPPQR